MTAPNKDTHKLGEVWRNSTDLGWTVIGYDSKGTPVIESPTGQIDRLRNPSWTKKPMTITMYLYQIISTGCYIAEQRSDLNPQYFLFIKEVELELPV